MQFIINHCNQSGHVLSKKKKKKKVHVSVGSSYDTVMEQWWLGYGGIQTSHYMSTPWYQMVLSEKGKWVYNAANYIVWWSKVWHN